MAKSDTPFEELKLTRAYSAPRQPTWADERDINGFDTETADGDVFMLSVAFPDESFCLAKEDNLQSSDIFDLITHKSARSAINVWYNLNFDANVMLTHLLDERQLAELSVTGTVKTDKWTITFIPSKFLRLKDSNRNTYMHYDVSQFFYSTLEKASQEWLNESKADEGFETALFGSMSAKELISVVTESDTHTWSDIGKRKGDAWRAADARSYRLERWETIREYARKDAELVRRIWRVATNVGEDDLQIPMGRPFSTGYLAESYLREHNGMKPGIGPREMASLAWQAYAGGRFEVFERGNIGPVAGPDINSAYPHILQGLPDPKSVMWRGMANPSIDEIRNADWGFIDATVTTDSTKRIQPFAMKMDGQLRYPALNGQRIQALKDIFMFAHDNGMIEDFTVEKAWLGYESSGTHYPFDWIESLYDRRKEYEADGYMKKGQLLKIILNSTYGKTCQTTPKIEEVTGERTLTNDDYREQYVSDMELPSQLKTRYPNGFVKWLEVGSWFNPFIAAYITGRTRLALHQSVIDYGLQDDTIMFATDSLMVKRDAFERSNFADDLIKPGLGNWDFDYSGRAFVVGAGVYEIQFDECHDRDCRHYDTDTCPIESHYHKTKTRGFNETDLYDDYGTLRNGAKTASQNGNTIKIESIRPTTVAEAIWQNGDLEDVGVFSPHTKQLSPDFDKKRDWPREPGFADLLARGESSRPLTLG